MPALRALLVSLGPSGAAANALAALHQRTREERAVAALEARIAVRATAPVGAVASGGPVGAVASAA
jgi:hypothetical protein